MNEIVGKRTLDRSLSHYLMSSLLFPISWDNTIQAPRGQRPRGTLLTITQLGLMGKCVDRNDVYAKDC